MNWTDIKSIFQKKNTTDWSKLTEAQKQNVTKNLMRAVNVYKALSGPRYRVVSGFDEFNREQGSAERQCEDEILPVSRRGRLLDLCRNATRNSPSWGGILRQIEINTIGTKGGKVVFDIEDAKNIRSEFAKWTRECDFFDGMSFNQILRLILKTYIIGGDMVLLMDDGLIEDSGKLLAYEPDEIGNTVDAEIKAKFGEGYWQSQGRVYNPNGRFCGVVVSRSERGNEVFNPDNCYFLKRDPDVSKFDCPWVMPRNVWRFNQGRGITPMASSIATILDLEDYANFEIQAAKKNAQFFATVSHEDKPNEQIAPSAFDVSTDFDNMTDEQIEEAIKQEAKNEAKPVRLDQATAAQIIYQVLPDNYKMELMKAEHPNQIAPDFIRFLQVRASQNLGLTKQYATLVCDGNYKAEKLMTQPVFEDFQKFLEQICDWVIYRWAVWADRKGIIDISKMGDNWLEKISWEWQSLDELDEYQHEQTLALKLKNMTGSYKDILGNDWKDKLEQINTEIQYFKEHKLPHPAFDMVSGGERSEASDVQVISTNEE